MSERVQSSYSIGLYERGQEIPPGNYGYYINPDHPAGFTGPFYSRTPEEERLWSDYRQMVDEEMTQSSAPTTFEQFLAIVRQSGNDPPLMAEKDRLIGSRVMDNSDDWGISGWLQDIKLEAADGMDVLVLDLKRENVFDSNGDYGGKKKITWKFELSKFSAISDSGLLEFGSGYGLPDIFSLRYEGREIRFHRRNIDPAVLEIQTKAVEMNQRTSLPDIREALAKGELHPTLAEHFSKRAADN